VLFPADEVMEYADGNADVRAQVSQRSETIWPMSGVTGDHDCMSYTLDYNKLLLHATILHAAKRHHCTFAGMLRRLIAAL